MVAYVLNKTIKTSFKLRSAFFAFFKNTMSLAAAGMLCQNFFNECINAFS